MFELISTILTLPETIIWSCRKTFQCGYTLEVRICHKYSCKAVYLFRFG